MNTFLLISGAIAWAYVVLLFLGRVRRLPPVHKFLSRPAIFPYVSYFEQKYRGYMKTLLVALRLIPKWRINPELTRNQRGVKLEHLTNLQRVAAKLDKLPTVERGKRAMGMESIFELRYKAPSRIESPYTHPMQAPPFFIPGVPARNFYEPGEFDWAGPLEEAYPIIKEELLGVLDQEGAGFKTYVSEHGGEITGWNTFNFWFFGEKFEENCALCPRTTELLESLPRFEKDHIMFSLLNPHAIITPHYGPMNGIIRAHLPLIVPPGCYIKVGPEERSWEEGKLLVFDDSFLHQVWNHSDQMRVVLFLNFWHPCFSEEEIEVLEEFRDAYERHPVGQLHARNQKAKRQHTIVRQQEAKAA